MPIVTIDRQPVIFNEVIDDCNLGTKNMPNIVDDADLTYFQFKLTPCDSAIQLLLNSTFSVAGGASWTTSGAGWSFGGFQAVYVGTGGANQLYQDVLNRGNFYEVIVDVQSIDGGTVWVGTEDIGAGTSVIGQITTSGIHKFYGFSQGDRLAITPNTFNSSVTLNSVEARIIEHRVSLITQDCDGNNLDETKLDDFIVEQTFNYTDPDTMIVTPIDFIVFESDIFEIVDNYVTTAKAWAGVADGCYRVCLADPCINTNSQLFLYNGEFDDDNVATQGWDLTILSGVPSFDIGNGFLRYSTGGFGSTEATQNVIGNGITYTYNLLLDQAVQIGQVVTLKFGTQSINITGVSSSGTILSDGETISIEISGSGIVNVHHLRITPLFSEIQPEYCSPDIDKCFQHDCTKLIHLCNQEDSYGFKFENTSFIPNIRVESRLVNPTYEYNDVIKEDDSNGKRSIVYGENRRKRALKIGAVPSRVHDFLSLSLISDTFMINNQEYFVDSDEYEPQYSDRREDIAFVHLEVSEKTQNFRNVKCTASTEICFLPPNHLLSGDGEFVISGGSGIAIQLGG